MLPFTPLRNLNLLQIITNIKDVFISNPLDDVRIKNTRFGSNLPPVWDVFSISFATKISSLEDIFVLCFECRLRVFVIRESETGVYFSLLYNIPSYLFPTANRVFYRSHNAMAKVALHNVRLDPFRLPPTTSFLSPVYWSNTRWLIHVTPGISSRLTNHAIYYFLIARLPIVRCWPGVCMRISF